jgi:serine O-acetyltransferase
MLKTLREDIRAVYDRDPAARTTLEIVFCYAGLHAVWGYRIAHWFWTHNLKLLGRAISQFTRFITGIEIHPAAVIGPGFFIDHGMGVVIGETAEVGHNVTLYPGVTLGGVSLEKGKRHPTLEDGVVVGAGAKILGAIRIGANSRIGANAVVVKPVPHDSVVVGVPGQIISRSKARTVQQQPDLHHDQMPDLVGVSLTSMMNRLETLEHLMHVQVADPQRENGGHNGNGNGHHNREVETIIHAPDHGIWHGEDFQI